MAVRHGVLLNDGKREKARSTLRKGGAEGFDSPSEQSSVTEHEGCVWVK